MKTAVSLPDDVFERADALARASGRSRSEVYAAALREYVARHTEDDVSAALDRLVSEMDGHAGTDEFVRRAGVRTAERADW